MATESIKMIKYSYQDTSSFQIGTKVRSIGYDVVGEVVERAPDSITIRWDWGQLGRFVGDEADRLEQIA